MYTQHVHIEHTIIIKQIQTKNSTKVLCGTGITVIQLDNLASGICGSVGWRVDDSNLESVDDNNLEVVDTDGATVDGIDEAYVGDVDGAEVASFNCESIYSDNVLIFILFISNLLNLTFWFCLNILNWI